ncbi:unnamed protein product [Orchesella dallaii]|uniref:Secreted protein n=1 Tax=Orchesella dallaii TaxID=48710 RepID=A0ABP1RKB2_9HEXA
MTLNPVLTFCGTWLFVVSLLNQNERVLGQHDTLGIVEEALLQEDSNSSSSTQNNQQQERLDHEACPCMSSSECPRIYGSNPLDFTEIGEVQPCQETGFVRCCGVSLQRNNVE